MSVTKDELSAYLNGRLDAGAAARIEAEAASDPELARQLAAHRDSVAASSEAEHTAQTRPAQVLDFAAARNRRVKQAKAEEKARKKRAKQPVFTRPGLAIALIACLGGGTMLGMNIYGPPDIALHDGELVAGTQLAQVLETQLSGTIPSRVDSTPYHILASFRRAGGTFCRLFSSPHLAGIACKNEAGWILPQTISSDRILPNELTDTSPEGEALAAAAQRMSLGDAMDQQQEQSARTMGWRS
ncbi:hypothetical protein [Novosphingobium sp. 9]|uniref:hypothetical protein n=1 Tax=Novosphingobium sp. 9 TaxID=2025349 RepID=UPI0021B52D9A|nr:hypothetical protein [Novosphingobium sp. 9]